LESVQRRSSCRKFASQSLTIEELSAVLELGYGIRAEDGSRTVGSGGGLYPNEIYLFVSRVDGLRPGLYHYNVEDFSLELIDDSIDVAQVKLAFQDPTLDWDTLPALFFLTAIYPKTLKKYGMRGWRILMLDSGHLAQSFWLATSALGLGGTTLAGGLDGKIRRLLKINGHQEGYVCSFALGHVER
jgi:SagB-type dehydrogenase family enzyme